MAVKALPLASESSHFDANQVPSVVGVQGTLGTSDVAGTAPTVAFSGDPATGAQYVYNLGPAGSVTLGNTPGGTLNRIGSIDTIGTMPAISLALNTGTITTIAAGTQNTLGTVGTIPGVGIVTRIGNIGTIESGTVTTTLALNTGTITTIAAGTQNTLGTVGVVNAGTINALAAGTITAGTVAVTTGTIGGKAASGAAAVANPVQIAGTDGGGTVYSPLVSTAGALTTNLTSSGTLLNLAAGTLTAVTTVTTVSNLTNGSVNLLTGTVTRVSNVGTLESGTIKLDPTTVPQMLQFGTLGTAGGSLFGTISAASGAGTKHYIQGVDIVMQSAAGGQDVRVLAGTSIQGTGVLAAGFFGTPGGGISKNWSPHFQTGTNSEIIYHFVGAGTAFITVSYWKGA